MATVKLLAYFEAGAHVESLFDHGYLAVANLDVVSKSVDAPVRYELSTEPFEDAP